MNRRDLIKLGVIASCIGLSSNFVKSSKKEKDSNPKQTGIYEISTVLPYKYELIDELYSFNKQFKKSKITSLYNNVPLPLFEKFDEQFQAPRGFCSDIKNYDDFANYVKYAQKKGFHFIYILNSPKPFSEKDYRKYEAYLTDLLDVLKDTGCTEIKVANTQLMSILSEKTKFDLSASTSFEYHNISQFKSLIDTYPRIKTVNIAIDDNRNFLLLEQLRKMFPKIKIELMLNENCLHGCPARISHASSPFCVWDCHSYRKKIGHLNAFCKSNLIYPWHLVNYSNIGINNFKYMLHRGLYDNVETLKNYFTCVEDGIENYSANDFFNGIFFVDIKFPENLKLSDIIEYLPDINHFMENGHKCASICDASCFYCTECAKKIEKLAIK